MGFFGFKSSKEVEEEKRQAAEEAARRVEQNNLTNLSNLSKGSQLNFASLTLMSSTHACKIMVYQYLYKVPWYMPSRIWISSIV